MSLFLHTHKNCINQLLTSFLTLATGLKYLPILIQKQHPSMDLFLHLILR